MTNIMNYIIFIQMGMNVEVYNNFSTSISKLLLHSKHNLFTLNIILNLNELNTVYNELNETCYEYIKLVHLRLHRRQASNHHLGLYFRCSRSFSSSSFKYINSFQKINSCPAIYRNYKHGSQTLHSTMKYFTLSTFHFTKMKG